MNIPHQSVFVVNEVDQDQSSRDTELITGWLLWSSGALSSTYSTHLFPLHLSHSFFLSHGLNKSNCRNTSTHNVSNRLRTSACFMHNHRCSQQFLNTLDHHLSHLKYRRTGTPKVTLVWWYAPGAALADCRTKGNSHPLPFNSEKYYCRVQLPEQHTRNMVAADCHCQVIDMFGILSSQGSPLPPAPTPRPPHPIIARSPKAAAPVTMWRRLILINW